MKKYGIFLGILGLGVLLGWLLFWWFIKTGNKP